MPKNTQQKPKHVGLEEAVCNLWMVPKIGNTSKSSILIRFSIIFTIHFGGFPLFWETFISRKTKQKPLGFWDFPKAWIDDWFPAKDPTKIAHRAQGGCQWAPVPWPDRPEGPVLRGGWRNVSRWSSAKGAKLKWYNSNIRRYIYRCRFLYLVSIYIYMMCVFSFICLYLHHIQSSEFEILVVIFGGFGSWCSLQRFS